MVVLTHSDASDGVRWKLVPSVQSMCNVVNVFSRVAGMNTNDSGSCCRLQLLGTRGPYKDLRRGNEAGHIDQVAQGCDLCYGLNGTFTQDGEEAYKVAISFQYSSSNVILRRTDNVQLEVSPFVDELHSVHFHWQLSTTPRLNGPEVIEVTKLSL